MRLKKTIANTTSIHVAEWSLTHKTIHKKKFSKVSALTPRNTWLREVWHNKAMPPKNNHKRKILKSLNRNTWLRGVWHKKAMPKSQCPVYLLYKATIYWLFEFVDHLGTPFLVPCIYFNLFEFVNLVDTPFLVATGLYYVYFWNCGPRRHTLPGAHRLFH